VSGTLFEQPIWMLHSFRSIIFGFFSMSTLSSARFPGILDQDNIESPYWMSWMQKIINYKCTRVFWSNKHRNSLYPKSMYHPNFLHLRYLPITSGVWKTWKSRLKQYELGKQLHNFYFYITFILYNLHFVGLTRGFDKFNDFLLNPSSRL